MDAGHVAPYVSTLRVVKVLFRKESVMFLEIKYFWIIFEIPAVRTRRVIFLFLQFLTAHTVPRVSLTLLFEPSTCM